MNFLHTVQIQEYEAFSYACWSAAAFFGLGAVLMGTVLLLMLSRGLLRLWFLGLRGGRRKKVAAGVVAEVEVVDNTSVQRVTAGVTK